MNARSPWRPDDCVLQPYDYCDAREFMSDNAKIIMTARIAAVIANRSIETLMRNSQSKRSRQ